MLAPAPAGLSFELSERETSPTYRDSARVRYELEVHWQDPEVFPHAQLAAWVIAMIVGILAFGLVVFTGGRVLVCFLPTLALTASPIGALLRRRPQKLLAASEGVLLRRPFHPSWLPASEVRELIRRPLEPVTVYLDGEDDRVVLEQRWELVALTARAPVVVATKLSEAQAAWLTQSLEQIWADARGR